MRTSVGNSIRKDKLEYADIKGLILNKEIRQKDFGEMFTSGKTLIIEARTKIQTRIWMWQKEIEEWQIKVG